MNTLKSMVSRLHRDEKGADMVEYILLIAAIGIPLLAVVIFFWKDIVRWVNEKFQNMKGESYEGVDPTGI